MKKSNLSVLIFVIIILGVIFFNKANNTVTGQTGDQTASPTSTANATSTPAAEPTAEPTPEITANEPTPTPNPEEVLPPTGGGEITAANGIALNRNFTGIWKARVKRPETGSSGGDEFTSSSSSSGDTNPIRLAHAVSNVFGSNIITFRLCVVDGELKGFVQQGGVFIMGAITSSTNLSENEVMFEVESRDGEHATITLKLTGEREFIGTFADGHTFEGRKLNPRGCAGVAAITGGPTTGGETGGPNMGGPGGMGGPGMGGPGMGGPGMGEGEDFGEPQGDDQNEPPPPGEENGDGPDMNAPGMDFGPGMGGGPDMGGQPFGGEGGGEFSGSGGPNMGGPGMGGPGGPGGPGGAGPQGMSGGPV
jgi:hypothetical protein